MLAGANTGDDWQNRLHLPAYRVGDAVRYANVSPSTAYRWQSIRNKQPILSARNERSSLSYLQLIELAVIALIKKSGVKFDEIRRAREYASKELKSDFPFAQHRFKTDGASLLLKVSDFNKTDNRDHLVHAGNTSGQLVWSTVLPLLKNFDYENSVAVRWLVNEQRTKIFIDPRVAFGAPHIEGIPTWVIAEKYKSGDDLNEIAYDYELNFEQIEDALIFEKLIIENESRCPS
jgi:uncharacterized protein (DUF433 family)